MAIAFVNAADGGNNGGSTSSLTFPYTVGSGSNRLLVVPFAGDSGSGADNITSVAYGGVAMTLAKKSVVTSQDRFVYLYYLLNPASGANNVVITAGTNHFILAGAADYTGVKQSAQPDATTTQVSGASASTLTTSLTTILDNCWAVLVEQGFNSSALPTAGTGLTRRTADAAFGTYGLFDSNGAITPAGAYAMTTNRTTASLRITHAVASFAPDTGGAPAGGPFPFFTSRPMTGGLIAMG